MKLVLGQYGPFLFLLLGRVKGIQNLLLSSAFLPPPPPVSDRVKKTWTKVETAICKRPN